MLSLDVIIFSTFLAINLAVGLFYSRGVTTIEQYAVGDRKFSTSAIVSTVVASRLGAGFLSCNLAETYSQGLYFLIPALGDSLGVALVGSLCIKRMGEFLGKLSIAEAMGDLFGSKVRFITAIMGIVASVGILGIQFKVASKILELVFNASGLYATLFSAAIIILYSTFGGIKAVTFTDVIQFFTFGAIIPAIAFCVWTAILGQDGFVDVVNTNPSFSITSVVAFDNPQFYQMLGLIIIFLPTFDPMFFQRIAMSSSLDQAKKSFNIAGFVCFAIQICVVCIAIFLLSDNPNLNPSDLVAHIINQNTYSGFKALVAVGVMAMVMSTADSLINTAAVMFAHDLCRPIGFSWSQDELKVSKIFALVAGVVAVFFALKFHSILNLIVMVSGPYVAVVSLPFILAIFGFRSSQKSVLIGMFAGGVAFVVWQIKFSNLSINIDPCIPGILANIVFLFGSHYLLRQPGGWVGIKDKESFDSHKRVYI